MAFNISEFSAQVNKHGIAQNNLFVARIFLPNTVNFLNEEIPTRELTFLCRSADLPELAVETTPIYQTGFGISQKRPVKFDPAPIPTVFMVDSNFAVKKFFHRWMQEIVHYDVSAGPLNELPNGLLPYEFGYQDDYAATLEIIVYGGPTEDVFYTYKFDNAYPISLGNVTVAWDNAAEVMAMPITFAYDSVKVDGTIQGSVTDYRNRGNGILTYISSINTFGQAINNLRLPRNIQDAVNLYTDVNTILGSLF